MCSAPGRRRAGWISQGLPVAVATGMYFISSHHDYMTQRDISLLSLVYRALWCAALGATKNVVVHGVVTWLAAMSHRFDSSRAAPGGRSSPRSYSRCSSKARLSSVQFTSITSCCSLQSRRAAHFSRGVLTSLTCPVLRCQYIVGTFVSLCIHVQ